MKVSIKPEGISEQSDVQYITEVIESRKKEVDEFQVNMEEVSGIDLASFNALVKLYVQVKRLNKGMVYINCNNQKLQNFIDKTHFTDVFIKG